VADRNSDPDTTASATTIGDDALLDLPLARLSALLRAGAVTCLAATEAAIRRAEALQPVTNAFVALFADRARARAAALDEELRAGRWRGPLHGVPLAHKDCLERAGEPMTVGSRVVDPAPGTADATVLARLDAAGAVDLGRLHLSEMVAGPTGQNPHLGDCRNAWDPARVSGGSSSGSAVAVATGAAFGALGSDTGDSTRIPAAMNGLFGLKPTYGRVSRAGCFPRAFSLTASARSAARPRTARCSSPPSPGPTRATRARWPRRCRTTPRGSPTRPRARGWSRWRPPARRTRTWPPSSLTCCAPPPGRSAARCRSAASPGWRPSTRWATWSPRSRRRRCTADGSRSGRSATRRRSSRAPSRGCTSPPRATWRRWRCAGACCRPSSTR